MLAPDCRRTAPSGSRRPTLATVAAEEATKNAPLTFDELQHLYGPWRAWTPAQVLERFRRAPFPWWVAGGWAAEAGGAAPRDHEDIDVAVLHQDLPAVRDWLADHHLWEAHDGALRPLRPGADITPGREQLWVRKDSMSPWVVDVLLTPADGDTWVYKRDDRIRLPLRSVGWVAPDGVSYYRPEVVLLFKAKAARPKDQADFTSLAPRLDDDARRWLREALAMTHPGHAWLASLAD